MRISRRFLQSLFTSVVWWLGLTASFGFFLLFSRMVEEKSQAHFEYRAGNALLAIENRVYSYIDVLRGTAALFATTEHVSRKQFHDYIAEINLVTGFPGITNLNFAQRVTAREKNAFEAEVRRDASLAKTGYPDFSIKPPGERAEYHVLTYIEPMDASPSSFGVDIAMRDEVAKALAASRDSGRISSSGKMIRISGPNKHVGLAIRMPLYRHGMPTGTVEQRRAAYFGSVGAGFDVDKLMRGAIDKSMLNDMRIRVYDVGAEGEARKPDAITAENLLFDSAVPAEADSVDIRDMFLKRATMKVGPRVWEIEFSANRSVLTNSVDDYIPFLILLGGLCATIMLFSISYSLATARRRAVDIARDMTKDLRSSEASLAEAQHMAHLGSWVLEPASGTMTWTAETYRIFGMDRFSDTPRYEDFLNRVHEKDRQRVRDGLERSMTTGDEFNTEHRIVTRDGSVRWVQTISRPGNDASTRLLRGTIMDVTERKHTMEALKRSQELLRELTAHQERVKEAERKRIAREIHDELGQTLLALRIDVSMLDARTANTHPRLNEKVRGALNQIDATVKTIRTIINNLRPAVLDLGLTAAFEWQVSEFRRRTGIACDLFMGEREFAVDDTRATSLFRILQESLTNVIRHAKASHVVIELYQEDDRLVMKITDNGVGIYPDMRKNANSFGLVGVEERIHALGGEFLITSAPGKGTTLTVYIPLETHGWEEQPFTLLNSTD